MKIKYIFLPIVALAIELVFSYFNLPEWLGFSLEYGILITFVLVNLKTGGTWPYFVGLGACLNFIVIGLNGFKMPVYAGILERYGKLEVLESVVKGEHFGYILLDESTRFPFLADVIGISFFDRLLGFASLGDIFLLIGVILLSWRIIDSLFFKGQL